MKNLKIESPALNVPAERDSQMVTTHDYEGAGVVPAEAEV